MPAATELKFPQDVTREPPLSRTASSMPQLSSGSNNSNNATSATPPNKNPSAAVAAEPPRLWVKRYRTEVSASSASVLSTITAFPLDSVKTRLQTYPYNGFVHCVQRTYQSEGIRGFFRGKLEMGRPGIPPPSAILGAHGHGSRGTCRLTRARYLQV